MTEIKNDSAPRQHNYARKLGYIIPDTAYPKLRNFGPSERDLGEKRKLHVTQPFLLATEPSPRPLNVLLSEKSIYLQIGNIGKSSLKMTVLRILSDRRHAVEGAEHFCLNLTRDVMMMIMRMVAARLIKSENILYGDRDRRAGGIIIEHYRHTFKNIGTSI